MAIDKYMLLGKDVSKEVYEKYTKQKYPFMGRPISLDGIHLWATDPEIEKQFPTQAAEAKGIISKIEREIDGQAGPKNNTDFHSFLEELQKIYRAEDAKRIAAFEAFGIAESEYNATMADRTAPEHIKAIARCDYERAKLTLQESRKAAQESYKEQANELRKRLVEYTADLYRATPDKIDQGAMQLLNTGILSADEMEHLAGQYRNNPPMLRIIGSYAQKRADEAKDRETAKTFNTLNWSLQKATDSQEVLKCFDFLADFGGVSVGSERRLADTRAMHWDHLYSVARSNYDSFFIQPSGREE